MNVVVNEKWFEFDYRSDFKVEKSKVSITEPKFDAESKMIRNQFIKSPILFPSFIEIKVKRRTFKPKTTIWQDKNGRLQLLTEF